MNATALADLSADDLAALLEEQRAAYEKLKAQGLKLDLTRGKPSAQQLDLADDLLRLPTSTKDASGVDVRNYGGLEGLRELREMFAELLWVEREIRGWDLRYAAYPVDGLAVWGMTARVLGGLGAWLGRDDPGVGPGLPDLSRR